MNRSADRASSAETADGSSGVSPRFRRWITWTLACYWLALFLGTHTPQPRLERLPKYSDKLLHFGAYAGLAFLIGLWCMTRRRPNSWSMRGIFLFTAGYAAADELLQIPVGRTCSIWDFVADLLGCAVGLAVLFAVRRRLSQPASTDFTTPPATRPSEESV